VNLAVIAGPLVIVCPGFGQLQSLDFVSAFVHTQVQFAPHSAFAVAVLTDFSLAFAVDFGIYMMC
jgi:hypothetical protein